MHSHPGRWGLALVLVLPAVFLASPILAQRTSRPGQELNIDGVSVGVGDPDTTLTISGQDFDFGAPLEVTLGGVPATIVGSPTSTQIIATVPTALFPAGDYLLTVSTGSGQRQNDEHDLTIGAVGPQGDQGEQGKLGDPGAQGVQGKLGPQGEQGNIGPQGIPGPPGAQGEQGKIGPPGDPGGTAPNPDPPCYNTTQRWVDCGNGTVTDTVTSLIYLKDANCFGLQGWVAAHASAAGLADGACGLTDGSRAGDWRLQTKEEWEGILARTCPTPPRIIGNGTDTRSSISCYSDSPWAEAVECVPGSGCIWWSSTTDETYSGGAWQFNVGDAEPVNFNKVNEFFVWPVRK